MKSSNQFTSTINPDGTVINIPTIQGYTAVNMDASSPAYYGFTDEDGNWYIMRATTVTTVTTYEFVKGSTDYSTNWTGRAGLSYGDYSTVF